MEKRLKIRDWGPAMRFYWRYTAPVVKKLWFIWPVWLILILSQLVEPYVYQNVFDEVAKIGYDDGFDLMTIVWFMGLWAGVLVVGSALMTLIRTAFGVRLPLVDKKYFSDALHKVLALDMSFHLEKKSGEMMKKVDRGVDSFWTITMILLLTMMPRLILAIAVLVWAMLISWQMTLIVLMFYPISIWILFVGLKKTSHLQDKSNELFDSAVGRAYDAVSNIMVVKSFAQENKEKVRFLKKFDKYMGLQKKSSVRWGIMDIWGKTAVTTLQTIVIISAGIYFMIQGEFTLGQVVMFQTFRRYLYDPLEALAWDMRQFQYAVLRIEAARKIVDRVETVKDMPDAKPLRVTEGRLELKDVTFKYQDVGILSHVNIVCEAGQATALVGHSGAGKSTITALLNRFYDVQKGQILIDGQDISQVTQKSLRQNIGLVMQENTLFNDTIYHNISYARPGAKRKEVIEAAKQANIHKFIMGLPKKYQTVVGERGLKLSGGEKQRVAIARVVLKNPPILILDEATSALDSVNEQIIHKALQQVMKGRTSIVIAHRLSTVVDVDKIVVLHKGKVIQVGTHRQLKSAPGVYKELVDLQVGGLLAK